MAPPVGDTAVVLSGGGARAAYQIGALRGVVRILGRRTPSPFRVISGTSAGAINAAAMAANAHDLRRGLAQLLRLWRAIAIGKVYEGNFPAVASHGVRWLFAVAVGARGPRQAASMLDNAPLRRLLARSIDLAAIGQRIDAGQLRALAINATSYTTGHAVTFYQGIDAIAPWRRTRRRGEPAAIGIDHLMASTAIPFIFPAGRIGNEYYADGSVRQIAPLSAALHLGARRILVLAVGQFAGSRGTATAPTYPSFAQVAGHALSSIFLDNLGADLERMQRLNYARHLIPYRQQQRHPEIAHVDALVLGPSRDLGELAVPYADRLPRGVRYLLRGLGGTEGTGGNLLSYLLFDRAYCRALLALGYADAMARREEIAAFLDGDAAGFIPLLPAELLT
jgi:NTE family protein